MPSLRKNSFNSYYGLELNWTVFCPHRGSLESLVASLAFILIGVYFAYLFARCGVVHWPTVWLGVGTSTGEVLPAVFSEEDQSQAGWAGVELAGFSFYFPVGYRDPDCCCKLTVSL